MTATRDFRGLLKFAGIPQWTVGDFMRSWNADISSNPWTKREAFDRVNRAGIGVNAPASRLPYVLGGGIVGRAAASYLGAGPLMKNVATVAGAMVGNSSYNRSRPANAAPGLVYRGF